MAGRRLGRGLRGLHPDQACPSDREGLSRPALRMAVGHTSAGEYHAFLVVVTNRGKLVLDNLTNEVLLIGKTKLRIRKMAFEDPMIWGMIRSSSSCSSCRNT